MSDRDLRHARSGAGALGGAGQASGALTVAELERFAGRPVSQDRAGAAMMLACVGTLLGVSVFSGVEIARAVMPMRTELTRACAIAMTTLERSAAAADDTSGLSRPQLLSHDPDDDARGSGGRAPLGCRLR